MNICLDAHFSWQGKRPPGARQQRDPKDQSRSRELMLSSLGVGAGLSNPVGLFLVTKQWEDRRPGVWEKREVGSETPTCSQGHGIAASLLTGWGHPLMPTSTGTHQDAWLLTPLQRSWKSIVWVFVATCLPSRWVMVQMYSPHMVQDPQAMKRIQNWSHIYATPEEPGSHTEKHFERTVSTHAA